MYKYKLQLAFWYITSYTYVLGRRYGYEKSGSSHVLTGYGQGES